jgi:hypothetical protein
MNSYTVGVTLDRDNTDENGIPEMSVVILEGSPGSESRVTDIARKAFEYLDQFEEIKEVRIDVEE